MKSFGFILAVGLLLVSASTRFTDSGSAPGPMPTPPAQDTTPVHEFDWLGNLELATAIAAKSERPLMVIFR